MGTFPHLPLFTDAFIADTTHLNATETGAYIMLLMMAWRTPSCRLPDDDTKLARWARVDPRTWSRIKVRVMEFWQLSDGHWTQKRLLSERDKVSKMAEAARENGKHGGRPKSLKNNDTKNPAGSSWATQQKAPIPIPIKQELETHIDMLEAVPREEPSHSHTKTKPRNRWPDGSFDRIWEAYPHKVGKKAVYAKLEVIEREGEVAPEVILDGIERYRLAKPDHHDWKNPLTWLNQGCWADEYGTPAGVRPPPPQQNGSRSTFDEASFLAAAERRQAERKLNS
jgi:uncharacterized protein YdaU (DUF1376 family)